MACDPTAETTRFQWVVPNRRQHRWSSRISADHKNKTDVNIRDRFMDGGGREMEAESGPNARPTLWEAVGNNYASVFDCLCIRGSS